MTKAFYIYCVRFPFQTDAFRGHGLSLLDEQARPAGSSAHAIPAGVAAFHSNQSLGHHVQSNNLTVYNVRL